MILTTVRSKNNVSLVKLLDPYGTNTVNDRWCNVFFKKLLTSKFHIVIYNFDITIYMYIYLKQNDECTCFIAHSLCIMHSVLLGYIHCDIMLITSGIYVEYLLTWNNKMHTCTWLNISNCLHCSRIYFSNVTRYIIWNRCIIDHKLLMDQKFKPIHH